VPARRVGTPTAAAATTAAGICGVGRVDRDAFCLTAVGRGDGPTATDVSGGAGVVVTGITVVVEAGGVVDVVVVDVVVLEGMTDDGTVMESTVGVADPGPGAGGSARGVSVAPWVALVAVGR